MDHSAAAFLEMSREQQRQIHLRLLQRAEAIWEQYFPAGSELQYQESVVGTRQELDVLLPHEALAAVRDGCDRASIEMRYREPITSLHDRDLKLPEAAEFAYYAIYNAFRLYVLFKKVDPWLIVNQSLSALGQDQAASALAVAVGG